MLPYYLVIPTLFASTFLVTSLALRKKVPPSTRLLSLEAAISLVSDYGCYFASSWEGVIHNLYVLIYFYPLMLSVRDFLPGKFRTIFFWSAGCLYALIWTTQVAGTGIRRFALLPFPVSTVFIAILFLSTLFYKAFYDRSGNIGAIRIICFAIILYCAGTLPLFSQFGSWKAHILPAITMEINTTLDSLKYLLLSVGFYYFSRAHKHNIVSV